LVAIAVGCVLAGAGTAAVLAARGGGGGSSSSQGGTAALSERAFLDLMIPHHQMAVQMAQIALKHAGKDLAVVEVARDILSEQRYEIGLMERWRRQWFGSNTSVTPMTADEQCAMGMGADMSALAKAKPVAPTFYADMIPHHAGAIVMAQRVLLGHPRPQLAQLARAIIDGQSREIGKMETYRQIALGRIPANSGTPVNPAKPATP
jgi:uncharacterized protein (DUF305 family)